MPVLMVSEKTWPQLGFSRNLSMRPSSSVTTMPNSRGLATRTSTRVTMARFSRWKSMARVMSMSVRASPLMTRKGSSR